jgi:hypothetical protein
MRRRRSPQPIPALPPGKKIRVLFDSVPARLNSDLPRAYDVTVRYEGLQRMPAPSRWSILRLNDRDRPPRGPGAHSGAA